MNITPLEHTLPDYPTLVKGPRTYGTWLEMPSPDHVARPWALLLFTGRHRKGNMANWLVKLGYQVCCEGCGGWPLRLRLGGTSSKATEKEATVICDRIHDALSAAWDNHKTWGLEGPAHGQPGSDFWERPLIRQLLQLSRVTLVTCDGCRFGYSEQRPLQAARLGQRRPLHAQRDALQPRQRPCHCKHTPHLAQIYAYSLHRGYRTMTLEREDL